MSEPASTGTDVPVPETGTMRPSRASGPAGSRGRWRLPFTGLALLLLLAAVSPSELWAQRGRPVIVQPRRDLEFGDVFAGVPRAVSRLDPAASGTYRVLGRPNAEVRFTFTLPSSLQSAAGQGLPIEFESDDAGFSEEQNQGSSVGFDPRVPFTARLSPDGEAYLWLGGTVRPAADQPAGGYESAVVLTAAYTGS